MEAFEKLLGRDNALLKAIKTRGFKKPTEIQEKSIPDIVSGKDVIAGASTGSGKTLAFAAGLINKVKNGGKIQGLVLTPTRELAEQVTEELLDFSAPLEINILSVYGGVSINHQIRELIDAEIVVGTPGRILDHISRKTINLTNVNTLVLDEADRMFDMGFREDVEKIILKCPKERQTLLFSATIKGKEVFDLSKKHMKNPVEISAERYVDPNKLEQVFYDVPNNMKYSLLKHLLRNEESKLIIIFCNTRKNVDFLSNNLKFTGVETLPLHGGFSQQKRNNMMKTFHSKKVTILIATDVAARGLDIEGISHIYNYDIPKNIEDYVHRIGRTARAGKEGKVINLLSDRDYDNFRNIRKGDFNIKKIEAPVIERIRIRWIPEKRSKGGGRNIKRKDNNRFYERERNSFQKAPKARAFYSGVRKNPIQNKKRRF